MRFNAVSVGMTVIDHAFLPFLWWVDFSDENFVVGGFFGCGTIPYESFMEGG